MRGLVKRFFVLRGVCAAFFNNHYRFEWGKIAAFFSWLVINVQFFSFLNEFVNFVIRSIVGLILWFDPIIFILATQTMKTLCDYLDIFHIAQLYFYYIHHFFFISRNICVRPYLLSMCLRCSCFGMVFFLLSLWYCLFFYFLFFVYMFDVFHIL